MVGRKPKPVEMKALAGNPGKRELPTMPQFEAVNLPVPRGKLPKRARDLWRKVAPVLYARGVLTEGDAAALELMCMHYALAWEALEVMSLDAVERFEGLMEAFKRENEEGEKVPSLSEEVIKIKRARAEEMRMLVVDERGLSRKHPLLQVWRENSTAFRMYAEQFGLTPSARGRLEYPDGQGGEGSLADELFRLAAQMGGGE